MLAQAIIAHAAAKAFDKAVLHRLPGAIRAIRFRTVLPAENRIQVDSAYPSGGDRLV